MQSWNRQSAVAVNSDSDPQTATSKVQVCIASVDEAHSVILPAKAIAKALGAELVFVHVIETHRPSETQPLDPVEWDILRREAVTAMSGLAGKHAGAGEAISVSILEGRSAEQICGSMEDRHQDIAVVCRGHGHAGQILGDTARRILENGKTSLLVIPETTDTSAAQGFTRILVPLDGSGQSERALAVALRIAQSERADIVLVLADEEPHLLQIGPPEPRDNVLLNEIRQRNNRVARAYLDRQCAMLQSKGVNIRAVLSSDGDVRRRLVAETEKQAADLVVLASHGQSGFADAPLGDVANFLITRSAVPVLMVRRGMEDTQEHMFSSAQSKGVRGPGALRG